MPPGPRTPAPLERLVRGYYLATPAFAIADVLFGLNVRVAFLDTVPALKWLWYAGACLAGLAAWRWPRWTAHIGLAESTLGIAALVLSVGIAYIRTTASEEGLAAGAFTPESVANLVLSAGMLVASQLSAQAHLTKRPFGR